MTRITAALLCAGLLGACATRTPVSTWGYSHWNPRWGPASMGVFQKQQQACLESAGGAGNTDENAFVQCMNANGWCTMEYQCQPPTFP